MNIIGWFSDPANWKGSDGIPTQIGYHLLYSAIALLAALAGTGYFALRRSRYLATAAAAAATLLVVDAWFDVMTTLPGQRLEPVALAAGVELPLAALCVWLSLHTQQLAERRLVLLLRRGRTTEARSR